MKTAQNHHTGIASNFPRSLRIIPPPQLGPNLMSTMEVTMQSLVLDAQHPVALELAGSGNKFSFIIRATTQAALDHVEALLRAEYPQIGVQSLSEHDDPFRLDGDESVSAVELIPEEDNGIPPCEQISQTGRDPLLGLLSVLSQLPEHVRAIVQIGLVPVVGEMTTSKLSHSKVLGKTDDLAKADIWNSRRIVSWRSRLLAFFASPRDVAIVAMANAIVLLLLSLLAGPWLANWIWDDIWSFILWGQFAVLTDQQAHQLMWCFIIFILIESLFLFGTIKVMRQFRFGIADQEPLITIAAAYRTRIIFYVIGPKATDEKNASRAFSFGPSSSSGEKAREEILLRIMATFRQFHAISGIAFISKKVSPKYAHLLLCSNEWHQGLEQSNHLVSFRVLATLWHIPHYRTTIALEVPQAKTTNVLPLLSAGPENRHGITSPLYLEHSNGQPFVFSSVFFSHHTLMAGKAGPGKDTFLRYLGYAALARGRLVCMDPNGELCEDILKMVPLGRVEDVVFIDLADSTVRIGLNPLDVTLGYGQERIVCKLLKILTSIGTVGWSAKMEMLFRKSLYTLLKANKRIVMKDLLNGSKQQYTLLDITSLLTNASFCHTVLQSVEDESLHRWWDEYYKPHSFAMQRDVIHPMINKVAKFEHIHARSIVGQGVSTINLAQMIAEKKIILLKLAKGAVGRDVASLIGTIMLSLIELSLEAENASRPVALPIMIDEYDMLLGTSYRMLAQLHKYGATFFLAAQSLAVIQKQHPRLQATVQANVKQIVAFCPSVQDAELVQKELAVEQEVMLNLDEWSCMLAMVVGETRQAPVALKIAPLPGGDTMVAESIRTRCRVRYTCAVDEVDEMLHAAMLRRIGQSLPASLSTPVSGSLDLSEESEVRTRKAV